MKSTRIIINDDDQFSVLETIRTHHGVNWRGMLIQGAERLEAGQVFPTERYVGTQEEG
ncbi:MAG: hypothetical protein R3324_09905 [Halobacteriales archaeon]|nr:hypothetical protein [Halobacteriales archaeon]